MSGHSKWHNIQKTKGAADAKRAQAFTKIAREMIVAVKEGGGGDPKSNSKLAAGVKQAGMVVGAKVPCVLSSRADSIDTKLNSIALAALLSE